MACLASPGPTGPPYPQSHHGSGGDDSLDNASVSKLPPVIILLLAVPLLRPTTDIDDNKRALTRLRIACECARRTPIQLLMEHSELQEA